jgi:hypothetical protein
VSKMTRRTLWSSSSRSNRAFGGQVRAVGLELAEDVVAAAVAEPVVVVVHSDRRAEDRVVADQPDEPFLDEVVQPVVEWTRLALGRGRAGQGRGGSWVEHCWGSSRAPSRRGTNVDGQGRRGVRQAVAVTATGDTGTRLVSASAARTASIVVSMSSAVTP